LLLGDAGGGVSVLLGNGDGTFQYSATYAVYGTGVTAAIGDLNGDGILDVAAVGNWDGERGFVTVLLGKGDGTFQQLSSPLQTGGVDASSIQVADVNGDGVPDVLVVNCAPEGAKCGKAYGVVSVFLGEGNGRLRLPETYNLGGTGPFGFTVADLNGDGRLDVITTDFWDYEVSVLLNDGPYLTSTVLTSSLNPSAKGQPVTFTALLSSSAGTPPDGETVSFLKGKNVFGTGTLSGGSASCTSSTLRVGITPITAVYGGDSTHGASKSNVVQQVVDKTRQGAYGVVSPAALNFGQVIVGQTSPPKDVSLKNTGDSELTVSAISISGNFAITVNHCANGVKPATHCNVYVTYTPNAVEKDTGTLTFTDNSSNSPQTVSLSGTGVN